MADLNELIGNTGEFISKVLSALYKDKIDVSSLDIDHLCYRSNSDEEYEQLKSRLKKLAWRLDESEINSRLIGVYILKEPMRYMSREIYCLELCAPKKSADLSSGLEHLEFVIGEDFEDFMQKYPHVKFDQEDVYKSRNPGIKIRYDGFKVKFHHQALEDVVRKEKLLNGKKRIK